MTSHVEQRLIDWATTNRDRDARVLEALLDGVSKSRVHELTGIARTTIDDTILREHPVIDRAAVLRARARVAIGQTAAEFDYSLATGDGVALGAMHNAAFDATNPGELENPSSPDETIARTERADALWQEVWPQVEAMIERAKTMEFLGWSDAARSRGHQLRYAAAGQSGAAATTVAKATVDASTAHTETYTADQAIAVLVGEGHYRDAVVAVFDSMVDAGLELTEQPDDTWVITAAELDLLREQLTSS